MSVGGGDTKSCSKCGEVKPYEAFGFDKNHSTGRCSQCRGCRALIDQRKYKRPGTRARLLFKKFGLTIEQYDAMHAMQKAVCAICRQPERTASNGGDRIRHLSVDHDHQTGAVRGLLCSNCNKAIGLLGDEPERLEAAAAYLRRTSADQAVRLREDGVQRSA